MHRQSLWILVLLAIVLAWTLGHTQNPAPPGSTTVQLAPAFYALTPISNTAAAGSGVTLTIPAPTASGYYNYVCYLAMQISNNNNATSAVISNAVLTVTNFGFVTNSPKYSFPGAVNTDSGIMPFIQAAPPGCPKSTSPTTATTFAAPASTNNAISFYAAYYQAP